MFEFHRPWLALLLLVPLLLWWLGRRHHGGATERARRQITLLHPDTARMVLSFPVRPAGEPASSRLYLLLLALTWLALTLTLMGPRWMEPWQQERIEGYDLLLAVDASHSMEALDFTVGGRQVSRMQVVKGVMGRFIEGRRNDRVGLVIFGSQAFVLSPLTLDRQAVRRLLENLSPRMAGDGTAMGDAIALGVKKLRQRPEGSRVLVLVADGENTTGIIPPLEAARLAAAEGVRIYAIGVGSEQEEVAIMENGHLVTRSDLGFDEEVMRTLARLTGGAYFRATDTDTLERIYGEIDRLERSVAESRTLYIPHPLFRWPLGLALLLLLLLGLFPALRGRRLELRRD